MDVPSSKPDFSLLTATDWMSGIDNGRYLNEVNISGAHDVCTQHMIQAMSELKAIGQPYAECQDMRYGDMLDSTGNIRSDPVCRSYRGACCSCPACRWCRCMVSRPSPKAIGGLVLGCEKLDKCDIAWGFCNPNRS